MKKYKFLNIYKKNFLKISLKLILIFIISSILKLIPPYLSKYIFNNGIYGNNKDIVIYLGIVVVIVFLLDAIVNYICTTSMLTISNSFISKLKQDVFERALDMPIANFDKNQQGYINERIRECDSLKALFSPYVTQFFTSIISFLGSLTIVSVMSMKMFLVILVFIPIFYAVNKYILNKINKSTRLLYEKSAETSGIVQESISGINEIKRLNLQKKKSNQVNKYIVSVQNQSIQQGKINSVGSESMQFIVKVISVTITTLAGILIIDKSINIGDYIAISQYISIILTPVQILGTFNISIQPAFVSLERLNDFFYNEIYDESRGDRIIDEINSIRFENVSFGYNDESKVFENISFNIKKDTKFMIYGDNGTGKSTIIKLLSGFYTDYEGDIYINDINIKKVDINSLRNKIGVVSQNIFLFSGTLYENLITNLEDISQEQILSVLNTCQFNLEKDSSIMNFIIAEGGKNLSAGQKQKIAIARMLLRNPDVIILDEATSNIDIDSKLDINSTIDTICENRIFIGISHDIDARNIECNYIDLSKEKSNKAKV